MFDNGVGMFLSIVSAIQFDVINAMMGVSVVVTVSV